MAFVALCALVHVRMQNTDHCRNSQHHSGTLLITSDATHAMMFFLRAQGGYMETIARVVKENGVLGMWQGFQVIGFCSA
jgi:hypothetical protein